MVAKFAIAQHADGTNVIYVDSANPLPVTLTTGDIEIGGVEIKNASDDTRAKVGAGSGLVTGDNALAVADPTLGTLLGAVTASPTANTVLARLKDLLSLTVLAAGSSIIGKVGIDQTTSGTTNAVAPIAGQAGVAAGAGAVSALTQRTTLASDDPAVASLSVMDDWDSSDACKTVGLDGQVDTTLSLDTSIFASGDVLADTQVVTNALRVSGGSAYLNDIVLTDKDDQGVAMTLIYFRSNVSLGTENSAPSISDANAVEILGKVEISAGDWKDLGGVRTATPDFKPFKLYAASGRDVYIAALNGTSTPTFTASGVVVSHYIDWN